METDTVVMETDMVVMETDMVAMESTNYHHHHHHRQIAQTTSASVSVHLGPTMAAAGIAGIDSLKMDASTSLFLCGVRWCSHQERSQREAHVGRRLSR